MASTVGAFISWRYDRLRHRRSLGASLLSARRGWSLALRLISYARPSIIGDSTRVTIVEEWPAQGNRWGHGECHHKSGRLVKDFDDAGAGVIDDVARMSSRLLFPIPHIRRVRLSAMPHVASIGAWYRRTLAIMGDAMKCYRHGRDFFISRYISRHVIIACRFRLNL